MGRPVHKKHHASRIHRMLDTIVLSCCTVKKPVGKHAYKAHRTSEAFVSNASLALAAMTSSIGQQSVEMSEALAARLDEVAPLTRRAMRQAEKAAQRKHYVLASASLAALVSTAMAPFAFSHSDDTTTIPVAQAETTSHLVPLKNEENFNATQVSRSAERTPLAAIEQNKNVHADNMANMAEKHWTLDSSDSSIDVNNLTRSVANNPRVGEFLSEDYRSVPRNYNPNHATGDRGNAYEFSQCTWWVYLRRHQLGLPVGSHMGNGNQWGASARSLGYWVDNTVRHVGDILVFAAGQYGSDPLYGHVAVVEKINPDGSVITSETGAVMAGKTYSRTITAAQIKNLQVIHY